MSDGGLDLEFEKRVVELFQRALDLPAERVAAFVAAQCGDDRALRRRVQRLLDLGADTTDTSVRLPSLPSLAAEAPELAAGTRVGPFTIDGRIGQGGMGIVYAATQDHPRRTVALKVLRRPMSYPRFANEVRIQAQLHHPRIAQVFLSGQDETADGLALHYFAMERIVGAQPITAFCRERAEPLGERLGRFAEVCDAVDHAHRNGVIHRDLKPSNILVDSDGAPKVIDFGIAQLLQEQSGDAPAYTGTPEYMAPEQRHRGVSDSRSDVYALGRVLHRLLPPDAPADLQWVVARATAPEPDARYATPAELGRDLRRFRAGEAVRAGPGGTWYRARKYARRHRLRVALVVGVAMAASAALVLAILWALYAQDATVRIRGLRGLYELRALNERARALTPSIPQNIEAFEQWLGDAAALAASLDDHRRTVRRIETRALPQTEDEIRHDRETHPQAAQLAHDEDQLARLREDLAALTAALESGASAVPRERLELAVSAGRARIAALEASVSRLETAVAERRTWRFPSLDEAWWHEQLTSVCVAIEAFVDPDTGALHDVRRRLEFARTVRERTLHGDAAERWEGAVGAIAAHAAYDGLRLEPQVGLVPLGPDPVSGLWEFAHLESGSVPERDRDTGELEIEERHGIVLVLLPGGSPWIGADCRSGAHNFDPAARTEEMPPHRVQLDPFFLARHEMTQAQWRRVTGVNPSSQRPPHPLISALHPVEGISWHDAAWVTSRLGLALPTEAQWEYAARAGSDTPWWTGREIESLRGAVNFVDLAAQEQKLSWAETLPWPDLNDGYPLHAPVATLRPNPFGLHHVHGNVMEWCADGFRFYAQPGDAERLVPGTGEQLFADPSRRAVRGGSHLHGPRTARSSHRVFNAPGFRSMDLGVRPMRRVQQD